MLNLEIGDDRAEVLMDVVMNKTLLSKERIDHVDRDRVDIIV